MRVATIACVLAAAGCASAQLDATPLRVCSGEEVVLTWKLKGDPILIVNPETPITGSGDRRIIKPTQNTKVTLYGDRLFDRSKPSSHEITVSLPTSYDVLKTVNDSVPCPPSNELDATVDVTQFSSSIRVQRVETHPDDKHTYTVEHDGKTGVVTPQHPNTDFAATPMGGTWRMKVKLIDDESCTTTPPKAPRRLALRVTSDCTGGSP